ncbi:MAG: hypothetical protein WCP28_06040 [Actinomycetes bacterium]
MTEPPGRQVPTGVVVGIGIDPPAIAEPIAALDPALARSVHEELLEALSIYGRLVFTSSNDRDAFITCVTSLPSGLAKLWEALLSSGRVRLEVLDPPVDPGISQSLDPAKLAEMLGPRVDLVLLERDHAELLGVPPEEFSVLAPGGRPELGRLTTATRTAALTRARELMDAPIRAGDNRELIWHQRLAPLVAATKAVVVYDRYVGVQAARRYVYNLRARDGLTWFLGKVAMFGGKRVRLITAVTEDEGTRRMDAEVISDALQQVRWAMGEADVRLDVVLIPDGARRFGHDRHIRFGDRVALSLGPGLQVFADTIVDETAVVARLPIADAKERERGSERHQLRPPPEGWITNLRPGQQ